MVEGDTAVAAAGRGCELVERGMPRRAAESLMGGAVVLERDRGEELRRFEPMVATVEERIPRVEVVEPGLLLVSIAGAVRVHGGEAALLGAIRDDLAGTAVRMGVAGGAFAARIAAGDAAPDGAPVVVDDDVAFLAGRDLGVLPARDLAATFGWLGIGTLGELAALPRAAIASRFGDAGVAAHRLASGESPDVVARGIPEDLVVAMTWEEPLVTWEQIDFAARVLGERMIEGLRRVGAAPRSLEIEAEDTAGTVRTRLWSSVDVFDESAVSERIAWQVRTWSEGIRGGVRGGVVAIRVRPGDIGSDGRQLGLFSDTPAVLDAERALTRLQGVVGPDRVRVGRPQGGRDPREQVAWSVWGEAVAETERDPAAPWPGRIPGPAPALVPPDPVPFTIDWDGSVPARVRLRSRWVEVLSWAGPWRRTGRWWSGEPSADRYQIVTSAGAFLCEVADGGVATLVGVYD